MLLNIKKPLIVLCVLLLHTAHAQTSWKGTTSTSWNNASNWTNGVPGSTVDAVIGDAAFTGSFHPVTSGATSCKNLTIGNGTKASTLNISSNIKVNGSILIGSNGTLTSSSNNTITMKGNWTNNGTYTASHSQARITLAGTGNQVFTGSTTFRRVTVNLGATLVLGSNITINSTFTVSGNVNPTDLYTINGSGSLTLNSGAVLYVYKSTFAGNYALSGSVSLNRSSTVNYASASVAQTISSSYTYGTLRISGGSVKSLSANLPGLNSGIASSGKLYIDAGTLDLKTFTANRNASGGGSIVLAAGTKLMIGGTNGFPANYQTHSLAPTSTVEYYGNAQTVAATAYGNLTLKAGSGSVVKTMPSTAMVIAGDFTMNAGTGTGVSATAAQNITFNGNTEIGASCTFSAGGFTHTFKGNYSNNGTFNGGTSTLNFSGVSQNLSGTGSNNFHNTVFTTYGITINGNCSLTVSGNMSTTTPGMMEHLSGGSITLSGSSKTLSGNGFKFHNLIITGSISSGAAYYVKGNFTSNGSFSSSAGTATFSSASGSISGSTTPAFYNLLIEGNISTAISMNIDANLSVAGVASFTASAGTVTFNGSGTFNGMAGLYNATVAGGKTLYLGSGSVLGIAGTLSVSGNMNVTAFVPNTVSFNSNSAQNVSGAVFHNLELAGSGNKSIVSNLRVNNDFSIKPGVSCLAGSYTINLYRHWTNNGTFNAGTSLVRLQGKDAATISGTSTFNDLTVAKTDKSVKVALASDITVSNLLVDTGRIYTNTSSVTITGSRTGNGIIIGRIIHNHGFVNNVPYSFEGPDNLISFSNPSGISSVEVHVKPGEISDFDPSLECVNREYVIQVNSGSYTSATLRYHYEDNELNAFSEPFLSVYRHNSGMVWDSLGFSARDTGANYIELSGISSLSNRYSASGVRNIVRWNGSVSSDWNDSLNWTTISGANMNNRVPVYTDAAQIGYGSHTNEPVVSDAHSLSVLRFGSDQTATLTIDGGSLTTLGSIRGNWSTAVDHIIAVSSGTLTAGTDLNLSDGNGVHNINLEIGNGTVNVLNDLIQSGSSSITFTGYGDLRLQGMHEYVSGDFVAGDGIVVYTGGEIQEVARVVYNNLNIAKSTSSATFNYPVSIMGSLSVSDGSEVFIKDTLSIAGDFVIGSSTLVESEDNVIKVGGDWVLSGTYVANSGRVVFNGTGDQYLSGGTFNDLQMQKASGTLYLQDSIFINSNLILDAGVFDVDVFSSDRNFDGGSFSLASGAEIRIAGESNFPARFQTYNLGTSSVVRYNGNVPQLIGNVEFGHLYLESGGSNSKVLAGNILVNGDIQIGSGATFEPGIYSATLFGNFSNSGTFLPGESTINMKGISKLIAGSTDFYDLNIVEGSITVQNGSIRILGDLNVETSAGLDFQNNAVTLDGNLTNKGSLSSDGVATFSGTRVQTISLLNAIESSSNGVVNFNGTIAPVIFSTSSPEFATVNINNTGGVTASMPWTVYVALNVSSGATFNGGPLSHTFYGNFSNSGTVISEGKLHFIPGAPFSTAASIKLDGVSFNSTGEVEFGGSALISLSQNNPVLTMVTVSNTHTSGLTLTGNWTISEELSIASGAQLKAGAGRSHLLSGNLSNAGLLEGQTSTFTFNGTPSEINGTGDFNFYHLVLSTASDLVMNTDINVSGNLIVNGNLVQDDQVITFNGSTNTQISGIASPLSLSFVEQNKSGALTTLAVPVTITSYLEFTSGNIVSTNANYLNFADNASSSEGKAGSFVSGPVRKTGDDAFVFPLGKGSTWARLGISAPSSVSDAFTAEYFDVPYADTSTMASGPSPLNDVSKIEYWICNRSSGSSAVSVKLYWENRMSGVNNYSADLVVARWNGSAWENKGQSAITPSVPGDVTSNSISAFSPFTFGSLSSGLNPLPVKLLSFTAALNPKQETVLEWKTISEENNESFTVERSDDGRNFSDLLNLKAAGNSVNIQEYAALDPHPNNGITYYRLRQNDFNGGFSHSAIVSVNKSASEASTLSVYPNPATDYIRINTGDMTQGSLEIRNSAGVLLYSMHYNSEYLELDLSQFSPGVYFMELNSDTKKELLRLVKK